MKVDINPSPLELVSYIKDITGRLSFFLSTDPIPVGLKNIVSVILGEGGTLGIELSGLNVADKFDDLIETI